MNISQDFLLKYNKPGPRYTSYPPANLFTKQFDAQQHKAALILSNSQQPSAISLYVHIPFCPKLCNFCGCTTQIAGSTASMERYIDALIKEIELTAPFIDKGRKVSQIHWGGGTPNSIPMPQILRVMDTIGQHFDIAPMAEIAMECSPAYLSYSDIDELYTMGFNRLSIGIQDLNTDVLAVINRNEPKLPITDLLAYIKQKGFTGVNIDLVYGLPRQTVESFTGTVAKVIDMQPDRLVTFSYAHVPWVKKGQMLLEKYGLPSATVKMQMLIESMQLLNKRGYQTIGMDHYAKPTDSLYTALVDKTLHRNFQGYCTRQTTGQVYGFGASSISQMQGAYSQNIKFTKQYIQAIEAGVFPTERGYNLSKLEQLRRSVINELMCNAYLDFEQIAKQYQLSVEQVKQAVAYDTNKLTDFINDNLLELQDNKIIVGELGRLVVRNIAMAFDPELKTGDGVYSKTV